MEPCLCAGSIRWVHSECLVSWLKMRDPMVRLPRCDVCCSILRVRLAAGRPAGLTYFCRDIADFEVDEDFDGHGLLSVLLVAALHMLVMQVVAMVSGFVALCLPMLDKVLRFFFRGPLTLLPGALTQALVTLLAVLELSVILFYLGCVALKALLCLAGAEWRPARGCWSGTFVEPMLRFAQDLLKISAMVMGFEGTWLSMICFCVSFVSFKNVVFAFGVSQRWWLSQVLPLKALGTLLPERVLHLYTGYGVVSVVSATLNLVVVAKFSKRAFLDPRPTLVEVLPRARS